MYFYSLDKVISSHTSSWKDVMYLGNHPSFHMLIIKTRVQFLSFKMFSAWKHFRFAKRKVRLPNGRYSTALKLMKHLPSLYKIDSNKVSIHSRLLWIELRFNSNYLRKSWFGKCSFHLYVKDQVCLIVHPDEKGWEADEKIFKTENVVSRTSRIPNVLTLRFLVIYFTRYKGVLFEGSCSYLP